MVLGMLAAEYIWFWVCWLLNIYGFGYVGCGKYHGAGYPASLFYYYGAGYPASLFYYYGTVYLDIRPRGSIWLWSEVDQ
jgi:hypothetical protein